MLVVANFFFWLLADQRHSDRESLPDRCQEADREVKGQAKNGCSAGRQGDPAEHPGPWWQHSFSQRLGQRWWGWWIRLCHASPWLFYVIKSWFLFDQIFQIYTLWHPIIPIDRMRGIAVVVPDLQIDDLNPQTTPDTHPRKSATAGKDAPAANSALGCELITTSLTFHFKLLTRENSKTTSQL